MLRLSTVAALAGLVLLLALGACASNGSSGDRAGDAHDHAHDHEAGTITYACAACGKTATLASDAPAPS